MAIENSEQIESLLAEKKMLEKSIAEIDSAVRLFVDAMREKKQAVFDRLSAINLELGIETAEEDKLFGENEEIIEKSSEKEETEPDFGLYVKSHKLAELQCPDGQCILIRGEARVPFIKVLVDRTNEDHPICEDELSKTVYGTRYKDLDPSNTSVVLNGLRNVLRPFGWTIDGIKKSKEMPIEYYLNDIPLKKFRDGRSHGFLVKKSSDSLNLA